MAIKYKNKKKGSDFSLHIYCCLLALFLNAQRHTNNGSIIYAFRIVIYSHGCSILVLCVLLYCALSFPTAAQHRPTAYRVNLAAQRKRSITLISSSFGWAYIFSEICTFEREEHIFIRAIHLSLSRRRVIGSSSYFSI
jgi:hypothetical protein